MDTPLHPGPVGFKVLFAAGVLTFSTLSTAGFAQAQAADTAELPIAVQMYTLRDFGSLEEQLAAVNRAGILAIETVGTQDVSADELNALLEEYSLTVISSHVPLDDLRHRLAETMAFNQAVGNDTLTLPYLAEDARPDDAEGWQTLGEELGEIAATLDAEGFRLAYHNHAFEMEVYGDKTALEHLFDAAGSDLLAELDIAWVARGGLDPVEYIARFDDRLFAVHAKDNAPEGTAEDEGGFATLGEGVLDWDSLLPAIEAAGVEWYIIEHDMPLDAEAVITEGNRFLQEKLTALREE
ncbi:MULTISPECIES: sugar phosphate isomerase/epimerase family protein [unclassified Halomonas]|uniref:sugar phosphate isomerase/epimerase family protein n=1 Tax=unclassified Halomonas TaxID=2609666 RepID=UPI0009906F02|nr:MULTISPECIES: sugar phosphate isomerase/epimerase [unclassified Halomonas]AQU81224.1 xylose isomerase [Halomonas sp. 'Soap Lake \